MEFDGSMKTKKEELNFIKKGKCQAIKCFASLVVGVDPPIKAHFERGEGFETIERKDSKRILPACVSKIRFYGSRLQFHVQ